MDWVIANSVWLFCVLIILGVFSVPDDDYANLVHIANIALYLNCAVNPVIYLFVCKCIREDFVAGCRRRVAALFNRNTRSSDRRDVSEAHNETTVTEFR